MIPTTVPAPPEALTEPHWRLLLAIADGLVGVDDDAAPSSASATAPELPDSDEACSVSTLHRNPSQCAAFTDMLKEIIDTRIPAKTINEVKLFLSLISGPVTYLLNGNSAYLYDLPRNQVEEILLGWLNSRLRPIRAGSQSIGFLLRTIWIRICPDIERAMDFPGHKAITPVPPAADKDNADELDDVFGHAVEVELEGQRVKQLATGTLVVGSGSGACAFVDSLVRNLEEQGWKPSSNCAELVSDILIVEKGYKVSPHRSESHAETKAMPVNETEAVGALWDNHGIMSSAGGEVNLVAGSTWGGGSRINWSACLRTDRKVREEWTRNVLSQAGKDTDPHGWMFLSEEWQDCMERVEKKLGVQTPKMEDHNLPNKVLLDGARKLGYAVGVVPQNIGGSFADHANCGASCTIGCRGHNDISDGVGKMSGDRVFLDPLLKRTRELDQKDQERRQLSVRGVDGIEVDKVLFEGDKAVGAEGWMTRRGITEKVIIKAERVVVSGGSIHSPALLLRSGVQNYHLGRHLHCHPCLIIQSTWPTPVKPWEGTILTSVIDEFSNLDGKGHGVKLESMCMLPSFAGAYTPWHGSREWREKIGNYKNVMGHIVLCRDTGPGRIYLESKVRPQIGATGSDTETKISYVPGEEKKWITEGFVGLAKLLHTMGAIEIFTHAASLPIWKRSFEVPSQGTGKIFSKTHWTQDRSFLDFLAAYEAYQLDSDKIALGSAHHMGTCRMSGAPANGVVSTRGKVWGKQSLYVADASVFPSASGVNPMITVMAFGDWIGRTVAEEMMADQLRFAA